MIQQFLPNTGNFSQMGVSKNLLEKWSFEPEISGKLIHLEDFSNNLRNRQFEFLFEIIDYGTIFQKTSRARPRKFKGAKIPAFGKVFRKTF